MREFADHEGRAIRLTEARLYYRFYVGTRVGDKQLCVIVKLLEADAFVVTAYLTDKVKKGKLLWPKRP